MSPAELPSCRHCRAVLERGFLLDLTYGGRGTTKWVGGVPERSIWTGIKVKGLIQYSVAAYRCPKCGWLDLYANEDPR